MNISELKAEKKKLLLKLKEKSIANKKAFLFASHYSYLEKNGMQMLLIISTLVVGIFLSFFLGIIGFILPYITWIGYDIYRMDNLINQYNEPVNKKLTEINRQIEVHMQVKHAMEDTIIFLNRINKKAS